jgi:hypothetical protein
LGSHSHATDWKLPPGSKVGHNMLPLC